MELRNVRFPWTFSIRRRNRRPAPGTELVAPQPTGTSNTPIWAQDLGSRNNASAGPGGNVNVQTTEGGVQQWAESVGARQSSGDVRGASEGENQPGSGRPSERGQGTPPGGNGFNQQGDWGQPTAGHQAIYPESQGNLAGLGGGLHNAGGQQGTGAGNGAAGHGNGVPQGVVPGTSGSLVRKNIFKRNLASIVNKVVLLGTRVHRKLVGEAEPSSNDPIVSVPTAAANAGAAV